MDSDSPRLNLYEFECILIFIFYSFLVQEIENLSGKASDLKQQVAIDERNLHTLQAIHHLVQFEEKVLFLL